MSASGHETNWVAMGARPNLVVFVALSVPPSDGGVYCEAEGMLMPAGKRFRFDSGLKAAKAICRRLLLHCMRAAASRTFCTAGTSRAMRMAVRALTPSSSTDVKPLRRLVRDL